MDIYLVVELEFGGAYNFVKFFSNEQDAIEFTEGEHNASLEIFELKGYPVPYEYSKRYGGTSNA